jgi:integrase
MSATEDREVTYSRQTDRSSNETSMGTATLRTEARFDVVDDCDPVEMQARDIVVIALESGIRLTEAAQLRIEDLSDGCEALSLRICGNTDPLIRWVPVPPRLTGVIRGLAARATAAGRARLFETLDGEPLDPADVMLMLLNLIDPEGEVCLGASLSVGWMRLG